MSTVILFPLSAVPGAAPDCNQNGTDDAQDIAGGKSPHCNAKGVADECDLSPTHLSFDAPLMVKVTAGPREFLHLPAALR